MSKKSKKASHLRNKQKKQAIKMANKARYAELRAKGQNTKSKRAKTNSKKSRKARTRHKEGNCGNIGCKRCHPKYAPEQKTNVVQLTGKEKYQQRVGQEVKKAA